jgi:uncharacterized protein (TIGR01244 family)
VDAKLLPGYHRIEPALAISGLPTEAGLNELAALGIRTVVDLRAPEEGVADERRVVEAAGLRYVSAPVTPESFRREDVEAVARVLDDSASRPVLLHCASGNRAAGVWTAWQVLLKRRSLADAEQEGRRLGLTSASMLQAVRRVADER